MSFGYRPDPSFLAFDISVKKPGGKHCSACVASPAVSKTNLNIIYRYSFSHIFYICATFNQNTGNHILHLIVFYHAAWNADAV